MICANATEKGIFPTVAPPVFRRQSDMLEKTNPDGSITYIYKYRNKAKGGQPCTIRTTVHPGATIVEMVRAKAELIDRAEERSSLKVCALFEDVVKTVVKENAGAGMIWIYDRIKKDLSGPIDETFAGRYHSYIDKLSIDEKKSINTISNHKSCIQRVLNTAWRRGLIQDVPVRDFEIRRKFRDRVLSREERLRLENEMIKSKSTLYWSVRMAEKRPIRGQSDLWELTTDNLVLFGEHAPYISFNATKTELPTICPLADIPEIRDYILHGRPEGCKYLFPCHIGEISSVFDLESLNKTSWEPMGVTGRYEFEALRGAAKISDFHFHDFKHMATTDMLNNGYTAEDLLDLRFYASRNMIDKCYKKRDAFQVLKRHNSVAHSVAPSVNKQAGT